MRFFCGVKSEIGATELVAISARSLSGASAEDVGLGVEQGEAVCFDFIIQQTELEDIFGVCKVGSVGSVCQNCFAGFSVSGNGNEFVVVFVLHVVGRSFEVQNVTCKSTAVLVHNEESRGQVFVDNGGGFFAFAINRVQRIVQIVNQVAVRKHIVCASGRDGGDDFGFCAVDGGAHEVKSGGVRFACGGQLEVRSCIVNPAFVNVNRRLGAGIQNVFRNDANAAVGNNAAVVSQSNAPDGGFFRLAEGVVHVHGNDAVDEIEVFAEFDGSAVVSFCDGVVGNAVNGNGILLKLVAASGKHNRGQHNQTNQNCDKFFVHNISFN